MMNRAHFIFTKGSNSFSVHIPNLESLSVSQIQEIQSFVSQRNGVFNFETYMFSIQKKLEFNEFEYLVKHSKIDALCRENIVLKQSDAKIDFGKYKGMRYSELPDVYLSWLKNNYRGKDTEIIDNEIKKRAI